jgi:hypothetical protein
VDRLNDKRSGKGLEVGFLYIDIEDMQLMKEKMQLAKKLVLVGVDQLMSF